MAHDFSTCLLYTSTLTHEQVLKIARLFNVSTDFLLGETNIPDRKNYDIAELGLSVEAAKNLYTGRVNTEAVSYTHLGSYIEGKKQELTEKQKQRFLSGTTIHEVHRLLGTAFQMCIRDRSN